MTKEMWFSMSAKGKAAEIEKALQQLHEISEGKHNISGTKEQGRLAKVKKDLEQFVMQALGWEQGT